MTATTDILHTEPLFPVSRLRALAREFQRRATFLRKQTYKGNDPGDHYALGLDAAAASLLEVAAQIEEDAEPEPTHFPIREDESNCPCADTNMASECPCECHLPMPLIGGPVDFAGLS